jgi:hypothetical protein
MSTKFDHYSFWYTYPYFTQDFRLFTPCPDFNFDIYAHYKVGLEEHYAVPLAEVLRQRSLFNGREFLMLTLTAATAYYAKDPSDKNYAILRTAIWRYLNSKQNDKVYDLHILIVLTDIKTKERFKILND